MIRRVVVVLALLEGVAWADDPLVRARAALAQSSYTAARAELAAAWSAGDHAPQETAEMYRLSGVVEAALGNRDAATTAFTRLLALAPGEAMAPGTSPKIRAPFDAAREFLGARSLDVKVDTAAQPPSIIATVRDPAGMVARVRVVFTVDGGAERTIEVAMQPRTQVPLPPGQIAVRVIALEERGNRLVEIGGAGAPIAFRGEAPPVAARPARPARPAPSSAVAVHAASRPVYLRWWPYAAATAVFAGATAYFWVSAYSDAQALDDASTARETQDIVDRGRRNTLYTNIGFGVTGAFAITAGALYILGRDRDEPRVAALPLHGGGALVLGGRF